jgi:alkylation response protein AidB-like acyl-CoA dehydrogenase
MSFDGAFRQEVREWLRANTPHLSSVDTAEGFEAHREWERALAAQRLSAVSWPERYGGRDASLSQWLIFEEEYYAASAPVRVNQNGLFLLAPTLFAHGTPEQRDRILPRIATAQDIWAQAWSEPGAGSDLAAIRSTASPVDGGFVLNGQKTWSSRAAFADRGFGLFRSGPDRHHGLTYLMFDLRAPGVTVRPIVQLNGDTGFAEIFLDDVFVPREDVLGEVGEGWRVAMSTASHERGLSLRSPGRFLASARRLVELWRSAGSPVSAAEEVASAWIDAQAYHWHTLGLVDRLVSGGRLGVESSLSKVFWSELDVGLHESAMRLLGDQAEIRGEWSMAYLFSLAGPVYAGTNEIQKNVIAERLLGLPR